MLRIRATNRTIVGYVRCARFPQMQALASLFACGQPGYRGSHGDAVLRFFKIAINPRIDDIEKQVEQKVQLVSLLVEMRGLPYSDCYRRSIACSRRGSHGDAVLRFFKIAINPRFGIKKEQPLLFLFWWRCGDLNPGSSFYTRHLLHAYSVIKFSYRRSPTDGGFEEAENADLLTAVGKSVARSV